MNKEQLRAELQSGDVGQAVPAMSQLLDARQEEDLNPDDIILALETMTRLGQEARVQMFQSFMLYAARYPRVSLPVLLPLIDKSPLSETSRLCIATVLEMIRYVPGTETYLDRSVLVAGLFRALAATADQGTDRASVVLNALQALSLDSVAPEEAEQLVRFLLAAAEEAHPILTSLFIAKELLQAHGHGHRLAAIKERALLLPAEHPLRKL
ncbi:MAG TPA: hypothetical protein DCE41_38055 [Cytophagales bacterium]|nr:hypothetical protein [Cytophagales bacterium]HAA21590.1 hypothetical protein [Cytophagales bacterium]HAP58024.1 hypothetical protein [Cytophagales bacterium]